MQPARRIGKRRIVRMHALQSHVFRNGMRCPRQGLAPDQIGIVANAAPVHGTQDHRLAHAEQDHTQGAERVIDAAYRSADEGRDVIL